MALKPMIVVGCGGSGGKVVQLLRRALLSRIQRAGWTRNRLPQAWQLLYIDTPVSQETTIPGVGALDGDDYVSLARGGGRYDMVVRQLLNNAHNEVDRLSGWLPRPPIQVPLEEGAGQMRAVGRTVSFASFGSLGDRLKRAFEDAQGGMAELAQIEAALGQDAGDTQEQAVAQLPFVFVISSMAGGTGAGVFIDICDVFRAAAPHMTQRVASILFTAEVFRDLRNAPGLQPNSLAVLSELMAGYFDASRPLEPLYARLGVQRLEPVVSQSGPSYPFVVGMETLSGTQLESIMDCYRAVAETLTAAISNSSVNEALTNYLIANWPAEQLPYLPAWSFGRPTTSNVGVVSSLGSAQLSLGLERFSEYGAARLARSVVDFQVSGWEELGRDRLGDTEASREQIVERLREDEGLAFITRCELRELNMEGEDFDQVLDAVLASERLDSMWQSWRGDIMRKLKNSQETKPENWRQLVQVEVASDGRRFLESVDDAIQSGSTSFVRDTPLRVLRETSDAIAAFGLVPTRELISFLGRHLESAAIQLRNEAETMRIRAEGWQESYAPVFADAPRPLRISDEVGRRTIDNAVRMAAAFQLFESRARVRERGAMLVEEFAAQVLAPLNATLAQMQSSVMGDDEREQVALYPGELGVPPAFMPPPFETCIIPTEEWPARFLELVSATTERESGDPGRPLEKARRAVGGGAFAYVRDGTEVTARSALSLPVGEQWVPRVMAGSGSLMRFEHDLQLDDVLERARIWLHREGTAVGNYLSVGLNEYLSTHQGGQAVSDHVARLERFRIGLDATLAKASPLVGITDSAAQSVHPQHGSDIANRVKVIPEPLPLPIGHPAREIAEGVVRQRLGAAGQIVNEGDIAAYFENTDRPAESFTYVSRLGGAIHPSAISSVIAPIATEWNKLPPAGVVGFWNHRRARLLKEFVPVHPEVLDSMIRGWIVGRMLGLIPDPTEGAGFTITTGDGNAPFPWPLLRGRVETSRHRLISWLPWLLESLVLGLALYPTQPDALACYEELYLLGQENRVQAEQGQPVGYDSPSFELQRYIDTGELAGDSAAVAGNDPEERKQAVLHYLERFRATLDKQLSDYGLVSERNLWNVPFGYDLFPLIVAQAGIITSAVSQWDTEEQTG